MRRLVPLAAAFFQLTNENKLSASAVRGAMPFSGAFFGLFQARYSWTRAEILSEPDAPVDQVRQAGPLHDLRYGACCRV